VLLRSDETFLTGETASRRALTEPDRVAREFKRRLGDPTPLLLGGVPYAAEALMARLLRWVVDEVSTREGSEPDSICVCHPANWGPYKLDLLHQAVRMTNLEQPMSFTTEPEAAATFYAQGRPVPTDALVAAYDLGGGTFDAAVLRKTATGVRNPRPTRRDRTSRRHRLRCGCVQPRQPGHRRQAGRA
jgi:molecular chaperone DnaK (HSP70)